MKSLRNHPWMAEAAIVVLGLALAISPVGTASARAQESSAPFATTPAAVSPDQAGVPRLINFNGILNDASGKLPAGNVTLTLSLYEEQEGGSPLWSETQTVRPDGQGRYTVLLGSTQPEGLPQDLFTSAKARWLGVAPQLPAVGELPRVLLVGMPYALKASDADTLGGRPASAYLTTEALSTAQGQSGIPSSPALVRALATPATPEASTSTSAPTGTGTTDFIPLWTSSSTLGNSTLFETGGKVGIGTTKPASTLDVNGGATVRGDLRLSSTGTATATAGFNSQPSDWLASSFNSSTQKAVSQDFRWQAEPSGNDTSSPSGELNLLFGSNGSTPAATGLSINSAGQITFATGQTFPGTGNGTITSVTAGTGLTGGGTSGNVTLNVNEGVVAFQTDLTNAQTTLNTAISTAQTNAINTSESYAGSHFLGLGGGTVTGNLVVQGPVPAGNLPPPTLNVLGGGSQAGLGLPGAGISLAAGNGDFDNNFGEPGGAGGTMTLTAGSGGSSGTVSRGASGGAGGTITLTAGSGGSSANVFPGLPGGNGGQIVLQPGAAGSGGGGSGSAGNVLVVGDDSGSTRGGPHQFMIEGASNSNKQLLIGYLADSGGDLGYGEIQATVDNIAYTPILLNPNGSGVGIRTFNVTNPLTIGPGQGAAIADGWNTYSSRRWKTNIETLPDALEKVEQLRGVSYDMKSNGKHEIGVIAEEVGAVVPEIVEWDKNGKDANGVDYSRLTALLIEATKQQQREIRQEHTELASARDELRREKALRTAAEQREAQTLARMQSVVANLKAQVQSEHAALAQLKAQVAAGPPTLVAAR
jgi:Chaperone of endosialidase